MSTYVLSWNPKKSNFRANDLKKAFKEYGESDEYVLKWGISKNTSFENGDRFFLVRQENGKADVIMSGEAASWADYDNNDKRFIDLRPDFIVDPKKSILENSELKKKLPKIKWDEFRDEIELSDSNAEKLEWLWVETLYKEAPSATQKIYYKNCPALIGYSVQKENGTACEICRQDINEIFDTSFMDKNNLSPLAYGVYMFPSARTAKSARSLFHTICPSCKAVYNMLCLVENNSQPLAIEWLRTILKKAPLKKESSQSKSRLPTQQDIEFPE